MVLFGLVSFVAGMVFLMLGAWPVFGFFGLDVALLYAAFKLNYRSGQLYETLELTPELLQLTRFHPSGRREVFDFNPFWVRVRFSERADGRTSLHLAAEGRETRFAHFLTDDERRAFADALSGALADARGARI